MPRVWNDEADARLFAAILATTEVKPNLAAVAARMGPDCTVKALTHRISIIKKKAAEVDPGGCAVNDGVAAVKSATPRKRGAAKKKEDGDENPAKKAKTNGASTKSKKKAAPVKTEETDKANGGEEDAEESVAED